MTNNRFMVDDAGTLIDIESRNTYDIVEEICPMINELSEENEHLKEFRDKVWELLREQSKLYQQLIEDRKGLYTKVMNERLHALQLFENSLHLYIAKKLVEELPTEPIGRCRCVIEPPRRDEFK